MLPRAYQDLLEVAADAGRPLRAPEPAGVPERGHYRVADLLRGRLLAAAEPPLYAKAPIGTASAGVRHISTPAELRELAACWAWDATSMLIQQPARGPLAIIQSVFAHGELVAFHACTRVREGTGGASHKLGITLSAAREPIRRLGAALGWHGALSADVDRDRQRTATAPRHPGRRAARWPAA